MGPLNDITVCDLTQNLAGPFCSQILGDLGARVIKVEPPGGDPARSWGPPFWGGDGMLFLSANRSKESLVLDLKTEKGREVLNVLAAKADVFLQSSRSGVPERLGFDYESIRAIKKDVIYVSVTAFGDRGPLSSLPGYEPLIQAFSGIMSLTGHPDGPPARVGGSVVDFGTGMWSAIAVLAALRERDATGSGSRIDTALLDTALGWVSYHLIGYFATGVNPGRLGSALAAIAPYQAFATKDSPIMILAGNDTIFRRLCTALGLDELSEDPRFATNPDRVANRADLVVILEPRLRSHSSKDLLELLRDHDVPCSPIQTISDVAHDPHVEASGLLPFAEHPTVDGYREVALPLRMDGDRPRSEGTVPDAGEHSASILAELGFESEAIADLLAQGISEGPEPRNEGASTDRMTT